jgi:DNA-binding XRE family transcriptional regulator
MDTKEFSDFRSKLNKTQKEMAQLLGVSIKAIHSYEQGWRSIPTHVERQLLFLLSQKISAAMKGQKACWTAKKCPLSSRKQCPAWEFRAGKLCWFINGTVCDGVVHKRWEEKMKVCQTCEIFKKLLDAIDQHDQ